MPNLFTKNFTGTFFVGSKPTLPLFFKHLAISCLTEFFGKSIKIQINWNELFKLIAIGEKNNRHVWMFFSYFLLFNRFSFVSIKKQNNASPL